MLTVVATQLGLGHGFGPPARPGVRSCNVANSRRPAALVPHSVRPARPGGPRHAGLDVDVARKARATRSATMLRWTSPVPPPMVRACENRNPLYQFRSCRSGRASPGSASRSASAGPPAGRCPTPSPPAQQGPGADQVPRRGHHVLAVLVGQDLADAGLRSRLLPLQACGQRSAGGSARGWCARCTAGPDAAIDRDVTGPAARTAVQQVERGRASSPQHAAAWTTTPARCRA